MSEPRLADVARLRDGRVEVDLARAGTGRPSAVEVGLVDVRAANSIRVAYDLERDGYAISMERTVDRGGYAEETGERAEVAFVPAWLEDCGTCGGTGRKPHGPDCYRGHDCAASPDDGPCPDCAEPVVDAAGRSEHCAACQGPLEIGPGGIYCPECSPGMGG